MCFYPRIIHSAKDALFTFHFLKLLCTLKVPNFNILHVFGAILKNIVPVIHCCSEAEAESLGIFFSELFSLLNHWSKRVNWMKECAGNLAFCRKFKSEQCISFEDFTEKIVENFGAKFASSLTRCLQKSDKMYMKARCSLLILNRVSTMFPNSYEMATGI